jgi:CrcB protein
VTTVLAFVALAAAGALLRAGAGRALNRDLPVGTLVVNVVGAFALGLTTGWEGPAATVVAVGGLGAFTTFSSFVRDAVALVDEARLAAAVGYVGITVAAGVGAAWAGVLLVS